MPPSRPSSPKPSGPVICAVIGRTRHKMMMAEIVEAGKRGARLLEIRLDYLSRPPDFHRLLASKPCPMIATVRRVSEGGRWSRDEEERLTLIRQAIVAGFDWVDLETDIADSVRRFGDVKRIISYHNFREVPDQLEALYQRMCKQDADVVKLAVTAGTSSDNLRVLDLVKKAVKPTIAVCMGDLGTCSRVLIGRFGAPFTYAAFNPERTFAPGIMTFHDMKRIYRFENLRSDTRVFGVVGDPVGHSMSPQIHNRAFAKLGVNAVYVPFQVPRGELGAFLNEFEKVPVDGLSVTLPHKEAAARLVELREPEVERMISANTLVRTPMGWHAYNTDAPAAIASLESNMPLDAESIPVTLESRTVLILGVGGVGRAIAHALRQRGCDVTLANRTADRAQPLADELSCKWVDWEARHSVTCDTLINCTPVGMHPNLDECPVNKSFLTSNMTVFDTVYTPETTMLIREARTQGCHAITGVDMFVRQAALQFRMFIGMEPPLELMHQIVRRSLSPVRLAEED